MEQGVVLAYSKDVTTGIIRAPSGKKILFSNHHWKSLTPPSRGLIVRFGDAPNGMLHVFFEKDVSTRDNNLAKR